MRAHREHLSLTQEEAAASGGDDISVSTWRVMEAAGRTSYRPASLLGVDDALGWPRGTAARVLDGTEDPPPLPQRDADEGRRQAPLASVYELALVEQHLRREIDRVDRDVEAVGLAIETIADFLYDLESELGNLDDLSIGGFTMNDHRPFLDELRDRRRARRADEAVVRSLPTAPRHPSASVPTAAAAEGAEQGQPIAKVHKGRRAQDAKGEDDA